MPPEMQGSLNNFCYYIFQKIDHQSTLNGARLLKLMVMGIESSDIRICSGISNNS